MKKQQIDYSKKKVFISHSSKDKKIVKLFLDHILHLGIGLSEDDIFCTSIDGTEIKDGDDVRAALRTALANAKVILLVITPNYKMSEVCLNEMGGAWLSDIITIPIAVNPISYKTIGYIQEVTNVGTIQSEKTLSSLRDTITNECGLTLKKTVIWDAQKATFLTGIESLLSKQTFPDLITKDAFDKIQKESKKANQDLKELQKEYTVLTQKYEELKKAKDSASIKKVEEKYSDKTKIQKLKEFDSMVIDALRGLSRVVGSILLSTYFNVPYEVQDWNSYKSDIDDAIRRKLITQDDGDFSARQSHRDVEKLFSALGRLEKFISSTHDDEDFYEQYEETYESELDSSSQDYWEEHFDFKIVY